MVVTRRFQAGSESGSGSGVDGQDGSVPPEVIGQMGTDELDARIREILHDEVATLFRPQLPEIFGSIKTTMFEYFDERYATLAKTVVVAATSALTAAGEEPSGHFSTGTSTTRSPLLSMGFRI